MEIYIDQLVLWCLQKKGAENGSLGQDCVIFRLQVFITPTITRLVMNLGLLILGRRALVYDMQGVSETIPSKAT
jgi:hypothetical protein